MNNRKDITDSIMEKIEKEAIHPKPRWEFLLKDYVVWSVGVAALFVGSIAVSTVLFALNNADWALSQRLSDSMFSHIIRFFPFLWILLLSVFMLLAVYQIQHTKHGYRYPLTWLVFFNVCASGTVGFGLYQFGIAHIIDTQTAQWLPMYQSIEQRREALWVRPDGGLLAGIVLGTTTDGAFELQDFSGAKWKIVTPRLQPVDLIILSSADEVGLIGNKTGTSTFEACGIRPWGVAGEYGQLRSLMRENMRQRFAATILGDNDAGQPPPPPLPPAKEGGVMLDGDDSGRMRGPSVVRLRLKEHGFGEKNLSDLSTVLCDKAAASSRDDGD